MAPLGGFCFFPELDCFCSSQQSCCQLSPWMLGQGPGSGARFPALEAAEGIVGSVQGPAKELCDSRDGGEGGERDGGGGNADID